MRRALLRLLGAAGWALLGALALAGLALSAVVGFSASSLGRSVVAGLVARQVDAMLAGRIELEGVLVLPRGGVEVRGLRVFDPDGRLVLQVSSLRLFADLTRLGVQEVGLAVELDGPSILLETEEDGGLSLARAFAPAHPTPGPAPGTDAPFAYPSWTLRLTRLTVRGGDLWWQREDRSTGAEVTGLDLDAEGVYGPAGGFLGLRIRAAVAAPVEGPFALDVAARLQGDRLEVPVLQASLGPSVLAALGDGNLATRAFRGAVSRFGLAADEARRLAPAAVPGGDLAGTAYAESDGSLVTGVLEVRPAREGAGGARAAVAARLEASPAVGFDVAVAALDPSRLLAQAPSGQITFTARGAAAGRGLADGRGHLTLELAPSRLRGAELGPVTIEARADRGLVEVVRLEALLPGLAAKGSGRWRRGGAVAGELTVEAVDLERFSRDLAALIGQWLPPLGGKLHGRATLAGTEGAPVLTASVVAPLLTVGATRAEGVALALEATGPLAEARGHLTASAAQAWTGAGEVRRLELSAALTEEAASLSLTGLLPDAGRDPLTLKAAARLDPGRHGAEVHELTFGWPGERFTLVRPAHVTFAPPGVDRLELADGPRRLTVAGGLGARDALDVRLEATRLDLAQLPRGLVPPELGLRGALSVEAHATGTAQRPSLAAHLAVADAELHGLTGLTLRGDVGWDGEAGRLRADLGLRRDAGGRLDLTTDLPLPLLRARPSEPLTLTVDASSWPIEVLRRSAGVETALTGVLGGQLALSGTVAAPALQAGLKLDEAMAAGQGPLAVEVALEGAHDQAQLRVAGRLAGSPFLALTAQLPLDLADLLQHPGAAVARLPRAPLTGALEVPGLDLAAVAGRSGLPAGLEGHLIGRATFGGTLEAPRGQGALELAGGAAAGYQDLALQLSLAAEAARTTLALRASLAGAEALRLDASLGAPVERLPDPAALRAAPLKIEAVVPSLPLARASGPILPVTGTLSAKLSLGGTLARPEGRLDLGGASVAVQGKPLGELAAVLRYQAPTGTAELSIHPAAGGVLWAGATVEAPLGLDASAAGLREAPATLRVTSEKLDLGFLPALAYGLVRAASGQLDVDLSAKGPLAAMRPRGTVKLTGGRLAVTELGDWTEIELDATIGDGTIEVPRLALRRGAGRITGHVSSTALGTPQAAFDGRLVFDKYTVAQAGMELVTLDFPLELKGTLTDDLLDATVTLPGGTIRLPKKSPRTLQTLEPRADIQVGRPEARSATWYEAFTAPAPGAAPARPFEARCRFLVPGKLFVKSERPVIDVEVKADTTIRLAHADLLADGTLEVVRGTVEPMAGRIFRLERGRVTFADSSLLAGQLDVVARYDNPTAEVTVTVGGTVNKPTVQLSSRPSMDDASIAMLIATGRTDIKLNTSEVGTVAAQEAGMAVAGAAIGMAFKSLLSDKLPVDQVTVDATTLRAGKYITDKLFVGYAYRFEAKPENGENTNEVRAEYRITPRWNFELRYGDAQAGDASLIWSKDY